MKKLRTGDNATFYQQSITLFVATLILNACSYFFHFFIGRKLGPGDYGIVGVLLAILYLVSVLFNTIQTTVAKFVSEFHAKKQEGKITYLFAASLKKIFFVSLGVFIGYALLSSVIADFLHIPSVVPVLIMGSLIIFALLLAVTWGIFQGLQLFKSLGLSMVYQGVTKLFLGIFFVWIGFRVNGAVTAIVLAFIIPFILAYILLKRKIHAKKVDFDSSQVYRYSFPVLAAMLSVVLFFSIDVTLIKHYFDSVQAGYYAALTLLGKVIYFGSIAISMVMFPKVSELNASKKPSRHLLKRSLQMVSLFSLVVILFYFLFPQFTISLLYGTQYLAIAPLLGLFSVFMGFLALIYILVLYNLSLKKTRFVYLLILFNVIEALVIVLFHQSLLQVVVFLTIISFILFVLFYAWTIISKDGKSVNSHTSA